MSDRVRILVLKHAWALFLARELVRFVQWRERVRLGRKRERERWQAIRVEARRRMRLWTQEERRAFLLSEDPDEWHRFFLRIEATLRSEGKL